ncbi:AEC family transporter [Subdoligranulum variabile]|uniref:AEC family transporter n=1 Tax=Subdoligranulum variabile TaxID=214851 RepID=UPI0026ECB6A2|nr:AEC family transporter [Subdoligranulum variabile]
MENLIFSLNATLPVFLVMVAGGILGKLGFLPKEFCKASDKLTFKVTLPIMLFLDMADVDMAHDFEPKFVLFCFGATLISILVIWALARTFMRDKTIIGEFVQASYRSSAAVLGVAFIQNIYGDAGMAPLMILGSVPLFNIFAVLILMIESPQEQHEAPRPAQLLYGVITNPILLGIIAGTIFSLLPVELPVIAEKTLDSLASLTTPLALLSIGASFEGPKALKKAGPTLVAALIKTVGLAAIFIPCALALGFREKELIALLIMLGSPTTPSSYVMAKNMGHEGVLTASAIAATTLLSALTLTGWIFILHGGGWL